MNLRDWFFPQKSAQQHAADQSDAMLDRKVEETQESARRMVEQSKHEIYKAQQVISVAEEALRSLKGKGR